MLRQQLAPAGSGTANGQKESATQMLCEWPVLGLTCVAMLG
jgi:hypothetical protein